MQHWGNGDRDSLADQASKTSVLQVKVTDSISTDKVEVTEERL